MSLGRLFRGPALPVVLAVAVVGASAAGTAALIAKDSKSDGPGTPPPVRNAAWTVNAAHDASALTALSGAWVTDSVVVRGGVDGLHAVQRKDGSPAWDLPVPVANGSVCAMSPTAEAGVGVFSVTTASSSRGCTKVSGVDVATGKILWTVDATTVLADPNADATALAVDGTTAIVGSDHATTTSLAGLNAKTGAVSWKHTTDCNHTLSSAFLAGGGRLATVEGCGTGKVQVALLDSASGTQTQTMTTPQLQNNAGLVALAPLTVADDQGRPSVLAFGGSTPLTTPVTRPVTRLDPVFKTLTGYDMHQAHAASGAGMVCVGNPAPQCWDAAGNPLTLRGLPASPGDFVPVSGGGALRFITLPTVLNPRASLLRVNADGSVTTEAELALPVSQFLATIGAQQTFAYGDASDLVLIAQSPSGASTAVIDVR